MGSLTEKNDLGGGALSFHRETGLEFFTKLKPLGLVLSLLSDHIQRKTVEKDFQILIKLNFINIYSNVWGKDWTKIW